MENVRLINLLFLIINLLRSYLQICIPDMAVLIELFLIFDFVLYFPVINKDLFEQNTMKSLL